MKKDVYDEICNKFIKNDEIPDIDICDDIDEKCTGLDEIFDNDEIPDINICDDIDKKHTGLDEIFDKDISDEYTKSDEIDSEIHEDNHTEIDDCCKLEEPKIYVNCNLKVDFDTKNKMIYLYPGKSQFFTVDVSKSCGDVTIKYKGCYPSKGICGNLGIYKIVESGIIVKAYNKLDPRKNDFLNFTAIDKCTKECYDFVVVFSCDPCGCCY